MSKQLLGFIPIIVLGVGLALEAPALTSNRLPVVQQDTVAAVKQQIERFFRADTRTRYGMMGEHYREVFSTPDHVRRTFDKESYEIREFLEVTPFASKRTGNTVVYVRVNVLWRFEGYEGEQTCHFRFGPGGEPWVIDWFLC